MNNVILKGKLLSSLLAFCFLPMALFSQAFYDGFESGTYLPNWSDGTGTFTRTVTTTAPAVGSYCFELTGGTNGHYQGIIGTFPASQPTDIEWRVKGTGTAHGGYIVIGDAATTTNNGIAFVRITDLGTLRFYDGSTNFDHPISGNTWYHVEMKDIDWTNKHFDIWIDGVLEVTDFAFRSPGSTSASEIHFYNFHSTTAYLDEVIVSGLPACTIPPTAVCQNVTTYLDGAGNATITASDLDGGSLDNCGTPGLTFSASQTAFTCADVSAVPIPSEALILTGVIDGPLPGGLPKAIELYVAADIPDLSLYGVGCANNGGGTDGEEFTFPVASVTAGQFIYVATDSIEFNNWFGFYPNYTHGMATNNNGDDAIEIFYNSNVVDIFGDINVDGTGQPWEYLDGWVYRNSSTGPDGSIFTLANWSFSGVDALDGELTNASAATPFPVATYTPAGSGTAVTLTVTDGDLNSAICVANVTVLDTISPTASQPVPVMVQCLGDVPAVDPLIFTDEADNCATPTVAFDSEISDGGTCPETITRTYSITDASGNAILVDHIILINDDISPVASNPTPIDIECVADVPAPDITVVVGEADNCTAIPTVTWVGDVSDNGICPEIITRTYSITDDCGNFVLVEQTITILDVTAPVPDGGLLPVNSNCDVTLNSPTGTDNCSGALAAVGDVVFPISTVGTTTVTWTYSDACGNQTIQTQDVIITALDVSTSVNGITITAGNGSASYQWIDCSNNSPISGATSQAYVATANGNYAVIITENGCSDTSACNLIDQVGIDIVQIELFNLYPNPTLDGRFTVIIEGEIKNIQVLDLAGRIVNAFIDINGDTIDASRLSGGEYIVQITDENDLVRVGRLIIQK